LQFFRKPTRKTPINPKHIIAPADGRVVVIEEVVETEYFNDKRIQISIFMSPLNVHINFNPLSGIVSYFKYHLFEEMDLIEGNRANEEKLKIVRKESFDKLVKGITLAENPESTNLFQNVDKELLDAAETLKAENLALKEENKNLKENIKILQVNSESKENEVLKLQKKLSELQKENIVMEESVELRRELLILKGYDGFKKYRKG
jgi:hypothetical protein